jgi:hypothetical protein
MDPDFEVHGDQLRTRHHEAVQMIGGAEALVPAVREKVERLR